MPPPRLLLIVSMLVVALAGAAGWLLLDEDDGDHHGGGPASATSSAANRALLCAAGGPAGSRPVVLNPLALPPRSGRRQRRLVRPRDQGAAAAPRSHPMRADGARRCARAAGTNATRSQLPLSESLLEPLDAVGVLVWQLIGPSGERRPARLHDRAGGGA